MELARTKEILVVNPTKGKKQKGGKKKRKKTAKKAATKHHRRRKSGGGSHKKATRRRARARNPGVSLGALALAQGIGMVSGIVSQPAAKLAGAKLDEKGKTTLAKVARVGLPLAQSFATGAAGAALVSPRVGQAIAAGGGAVAGLHLMSALANALGKDGKQNELLTKAGFAMLSGEGLFERDGQMWRQTSDGGEVPLFAISNVTPYRLKLSDGQVMSVGHLGDDGANSIVVTDEGRIMMLPLGSLDGYQQATGLGGYQSSERLSGLQSVG